MKTACIVTSDQIYIRFIDDRSINDKDFGQIVKDRKKEMVEYVDILNKTDLKDYQYIVIAFNNHFAVFWSTICKYFFKVNG